jgi:PIN domain nuclease of toxin-antitoxin system
VLKFLLDSHTLIWTLYEVRLLPLDVQSILTDERNELLISHVSIWEIVDKAAKFHLPMAGTSADAILRDIRGIHAPLLPINLEDVVSSVKLPRHHHDPLDRVLIAQARRLDATLLSKDGKFKQVRREAVLGLRISYWTGAAGRIAVYTFSLCETLLCRVGCCWVSVLGWFP